MVKNIADIKYPNSDKCLMSDEEFANFQTGEGKDLRWINYW